MGVRTSAGLMGHADGRLHVDVRRTVNRVLPDVASKVEASRHDRSVSPDVRVRVGGLARSHRARRAIRERDVPEPCGWQIQHRVVSAGAIENARAVGQPCEAVDVPVPMVTAGAAA